MSNNKVAVIGGGISGLVVAYRLAQKGFRVKLFESQDRLGGLARTLKISGEPVEAYYHYFFSSDAYFLRMCRELGIFNRLVWMNDQMGYLSAGRLFDFGTPLSLLRFSPLSLRDKIRFGVSILKIKNEKSLEKLDQCTAEEWLIRNSGAKVFEVIWRPLLIQKFGEDYKGLPMAWLWSKIKVRNRSRRFVFGDNRLAYLGGSLQVFIDSLEGRIRRLGGEIILEQKIERIELGRDKRYTVAAKAATGQFEVVVSTVAPQMLDSLITFPAGFNERLKVCKQLGVVCILLETSKKLTDYCWLNIGDPSFPFGLVVEHTNFYSTVHYNNRHLIYLSKYLYPSDKFFNLNDRETVDYFVKHLSRINKDFSRDWIVGAHISRDAFAQPLIDKNYLAIKPGYATTLENFYAVSTSHIYPEDRGVNYAIEKAQGLVEFICSRQ
jgi:protoporphyrinogen oxidase